MAKNKMVQKRSSDLMAQYPQKFTFDELAVVDDDTLGNMHKSHVDAINRMSSHDLNSSPWEIELCYVQREMQMRILRKELHAEYLATAVPHEVD
jgi:hypothetical protein